ncbi:ATP-binding protein [Chryseolinea lacunae]|uniref:histidine kinase n=1 Tax=Chryseolinea lacunae TaxID=2801331 RepID=A0ABS1KT58_9BACT|nr:ATP-binding protein [Chryseolinea lacunae]MBL0742549.1 GHKL domain-containing protein [Chryseolinea lacunae]
MAVASHRKVITETELDSTVKALSRMPLAEAERILLPDVQNNGALRGDLQAMRILARVQLSKGKTVEALQVAERILQGAEAFKHNTEKGPALYLIGSIYNRENQKEKALDAFLKAAPWSEKYGDAFESFSNYYEAANIQFNGDNLEASAALLNRALHLYHLEPENFNSNDRLTVVMGAWNTLGLAYMKLGKNASSLLALRASQKLAEETRNAFWAGLTTGNIGTLYHRTGQYDSALLMCAIDKKVSLKFGNWHSAANAIFVMGSTYEKLGRRAEARQAFDTVGILIRAHHFMMPEYYNKVAGFYSEAGDYKTAYSFTRKFQAERDSILAKRNSSERANLQAAFDFEKKLANHNLVVKDNQLKDEQLKTQSFLTITIALGLGLALVLISFLYRRNRFRKKVNKDLEDKVKTRTRKLLEANRELDTFLYRSSHDLRRPITTILGLNNIGQHLIKEELAREILQKVNLTARAMDLMLLKLATSHDLNNHAVELSIIRFNELLSDVIKKFEADLNEQNIRIAVSVDEVRFVSDERLLRIIIMNLIDNAIHFSNPEHTNAIHIHVTEEQGELVLEVSDKGIGIAQPFHNEVFKPFFRGSERSKGNGLGLYLVKKALDKLGGKIRFQSAVGKGTFFSVTIPNE